MGEIYANSRLVFMWLGAEGEGTQRAFETIRQWKRCQYGIKLESLYSFIVIQARDTGAVPGELGQGVSIVVRLCSNLYWRRLWIIQEVILGGALNVSISGNQRGNWRDLGLVVSNMRRIHPMQKWQRGVQLST